VLRVQQVLTVLLAQPVQQAHKEQRVQQEQVVLRVPQVLPGQRDLLGKPVPLEQAVVRALMVPQVPRAQQVLLGKQVQREQRELPVQPVQVEQLVLLDKQDPQVQQE